MRPIKEIQTQINGTIRNNLPKMVISIVALRFLSTIAVTLIAAPVSLVFLLDSGSIFSSVMLLGSSILSEIVTVFLMYGFFVLLGRFYREERAIIGYLFQAFRDWKRMGLVTLLVCLVTIVLAFLTAFPSLKIIQHYKGDEIETLVLEEIANATVAAEAGNAAAVNVDNSALGETERSIVAAASEIDVVTTIAMRMYDEFIKYLPFFLVPYLILFVLILVRYAFVFPILYHEPEITVRQALKKSRLLLKKKNFKLIWFCLRCSLYPILAAVVCYVGTLFINVDFLLTVVSLLFQVAFYFSIIVIMLSVNAFYYEHADPETLCISSPTEQDVN
ncbi:MAG: hypothetical protein J5747_02875 [Spirochaetaceae bacterium]|nr:hypothetical protein [Spirochaetaceae bacterium]